MFHIIPPVNEVTKHLQSPLTCHTNHAEFNDCSITEYDGNDIVHEDAVNLHGKKLKYV